MRRRFSGGVTPKVAKVIARLVVVGFVLVSVYLQNWFLSFSFSVLFLSLNKLESEFENV
jgi:hypothetical protein